MRRIYLLSLLLTMISCTGIPVEESTNEIENLSNGFINPPNDTKPGAFWCWLNGNITKQAITRDLKEMSEKGMGRAEIWDVAAVHNPNNFIPAGEPFLSDNSVELIHHALKEGKKYGIEIGMIGSSGWNAGGDWVEPQWASKQLYYSEITVSGSQAKFTTIPFPSVPAECPKGSDGLPLYYKEVAVLAIPQNQTTKSYKKNDVFDLTDSVKEGVIQTSLPKGQWTILRFICSNNGQKLIVPSPHSEGLFIDFFDPYATKKHLSHILNRLEIDKRKGNEDAGTLSYIEFDSMELAEGVPWTDNMPTIFHDRAGYDILNFLPVLTGWEIEDLSEKFMYDWNRVISDQLIYSHYQTGKEFLQPYGIDLVAEAGGPGPPIWNTCPVDALKALGNVTIPRGEFWIKHRNMFLIKEVASASHIYDKNIVDAESFTTWRRWKDSPFDLKKSVDRAFCEGLNRVTFHTFASTSPEDGLPGKTYHAGIDINPATTWWEKSSPFMNYLSRCSYLLQQGKPVADVCYFYGDEAPNFFPKYHNVPEKPTLPGLSNGYDFDVVNGEVILNKMSVKNGKIVLPHGISYEVLLLKDDATISLAVLQKIEQMVKDGATVIGSPPIEIPGLGMSDEQIDSFNRIKKELWNNLNGKDKNVNNYGKGKIVWGIEVDEVLKDKRITKDFSVNHSAPIDYIHRELATGDLYFLRNESQQSFDGQCTFRSEKKHIELWNPVTGKQLKAVPFQNGQQSTTLSLHLPPGGSIFVVFLNEDRKNIPHQKTYKTIQEEIIDTGWTLNFPKNWGAPEKVIVDTLYSWTDSTIEGIKYFSGTATYSKTIRINSLYDAEKIVLNLGEVKNLAEVFINNEPVEILWTEPYTTDITQHLHLGENEIKIEVVNLWVNRLTGDMYLPIEDRFCKTNHPFITEENPPGGGDEVYRTQPSGLLGPVKIIYLQTQK